MQRHHAQQTTLLSAVVESNSSCSILYIHSLTACLPALQSWLECNRAFLHSVLLATDAPGSFAHTTASHDCCPLLLLAHDNVALPARRCTQPQMLGGPAARDSSACTMESPQRL